MMVDIKPLLVLVVVVLTGLAAGSFLNVCIVRLPRHLSVIHPRSCCSSCGQHLSTCDLIPIVSWLLQQGRCRYCQSPVSGLYPAVEAATAGLFVICALCAGSAIWLLKALVFTAFLLLIAIIDYQHQLIFNSVLWWLAGSGLVMQWLNMLVCGVASIDVVGILAGILTGGGVLLLLAIASRGGMGGGDIKFGAAIGVWLGWPYTLIAVGLSFAIGGLTGVWLLTVNRKAPHDRIAFGPFIAVAAFISMVYGDSILNATGQLL